MKCGFGWRCSGCLEMWNFGNCFSVKGGLELWVKYYEIRFWVCVFGFWIWRFWNGLSMEGCFWICLIDCIKNGYVIVCIVLDMMILFFLFVFICFLVWFLVFLSINGNGCCFVCCFEMVFWIFFVWGIGLFFSMN